MKKGSALGPSQRDRGISELEVFSFVDCAVERGPGGERERLQMETGLKGPLRATSFRSEASWLKATIERVSGEKTVQTFHHKQLPKFEGNKEDR